MSLPKPAAGTAVLVTGASSGIGTELAKGIAELGHDLILVARRVERLEAVGAELTEAHGVAVTVEPCDLGDPAARRQLIETIKNGDKTIVGLCNCAGFGTAGEFVTLPVEREIGEIELNATALLELTHAFAGPMVEHGAGAILNVASIAAFQPLPGMATYSATKAFAQTFSEAVHQELAGTGVSCTALCPGPVETEWAEIANAQAVMFGPAKVSPAKVAADGLKGMLDGKRSVVPGAVPAAMGAAGRYVPRSVLLPALRIGGRLRRRG